MFRRRLLFSIATAVAVASLARGEGDPAPSTAPIPRFEFESFGPSRPLARAERIVIARADAVTELPLGSAVVRCTVLEVILPIPVADANAALLRPKAEEVVVLANHGEFRAATEYVLFLERFREGGRYVALARIAAGDRDYAAKVRVLKAFVAVDRLEPLAVREAKIRDVLVQNLEDPDSFVRWNAIKELEAFAKNVKDRPDAFGAESRARLVARTLAETNTEMRAALVAILKLLGVDLRE